MHIIAHPMLKKKHVQKVLVVLFVCDMGSTGSQSPKVLPTTFRCAAVFMWYVRHVYTHLLLSKGPW